MALRHATRRRVALIVALALTALLAPSAMAADDASWNTNCSSGRICVYKHGDFGTPLAATSGGSNDQDYTNDNYPNNAGNLNDTMSSAINYKTSGKVLWYPNVNYAGTPFCLNHGVAAVYVGDGFNDRASSHISISGSC